MMSHQITNLALECSGRTSVLLSETVGPLTTAFKIATS